MAISKCLTTIILLHLGFTHGSHIWTRSTAEESYSEDLLAPFYNKRALIDKNERNAQCSLRSGITYTSRTTASLDIRFPSVHTNSDDEYLCTGYKVPFEREKSFVVKFIPHADMEQTHHMLVYGCKELASKKSYWECSQPCLGQGVTLFAWARNAPELTLPKDVGFSIGKETKIRYIAVQMHFAKAFKDGSCAGVTAEVTSQRQKYFAGIKLFGAFNIFLPPHTMNVPTPITCVNRIKSPLHVFAFRTHSHMLGNVITGYRYRGNNYKMIGKGNPKWPQSFYPRVGGEIILRKGDVIMAECIYNNTRDITVTAGPSGSDEMCNMYLMYYTSDSEAVVPDCWGSNTDVEFPASVMDMSPYPGYAGQDSMDAIASGKAKAPAVPPEHIHHHHGVAVEKGYNPSIATGDQTNEPVFTDVEINKRLNELNTSAISRSRGHGMPAYQGLQADLMYPLLSQQYKIGQVGGLVAAPDGSVYVFHRGNRTWTGRSFDSKNHFTEPDNPIDVDTVYHLDKNTGRVLHSWGRGQFFMPHGASLDHEGNLWLTDVAMHQVFKYDTKESSKPLMTLGVRMQPGKDTKHFCKPTDVAVDADGTFFIADGYCNGRVMKFSDDGTFLKQWGKMTTSKEALAFQVPPLHFFVAHNIILCGPDKSELCVADRENGRIQCFTKDGMLTRIIQDKARTGTRIFAITYSPLEGGVIYGVNGPGIVTQEQAGGFTINYATGKVIDRWQPAQDRPLTDPHDITASPDGDQVYVGDLSHKKLFKFNDIPSENGDEIATAVKNLPIEAVTEISVAANVKEGSSDSEARGATATIIIICLVAVPTIGMIVAVICIRNKAKRLREYDILSKSPNTLSSFGLKGAPEKQGFKRISTESTDDEADSDVEVFSMKNTLRSQKSSIYF